MKNLNTYIIEKNNNWKLGDDERNALSDFIGVLCGNLGDENDQKEFKIVIDSLDDKEIEQLKDLHDCLDNNQTYKTINRNIIVDDIPLINKIYKLMDDNDLFNENWDLIDAFEKICL